MKKYRNIEELIRSFEKLQALVIGDVMIDSYLWGNVNRISPEAPVPIVTINKKEERLGGAANVAINLLALGATPLLCSVIGSGPESRSFIELMKQQQLSTDGIYLSPTRSTTVKTRVIGNKHQMLRVDDEMEEEISTAERRQLINRIETLISTKNIDVIIFEDYDKGVISRSLIDRVVKMARKKNIPVAVDPKKRNFSHYKNITLLKPNLKELREGMKLDLEKDGMEEVREAARKLAQNHQIDTVLVTLSEKGAFVYSRNEEKYVPAHVRNISDVSGAGDTVIAVASLCLALNVSPSVIAALSNFAGGLVCEKVGVVPIEKAQLLKEARAANLL